MESIEQSIAYLKGLMEGVDLDCSTKESKIFYAITQVLDAMAEEMDVLHEQSSYCEDMIDELLDDDLYFDENEEASSDDEFVEIECPNCHEMVYFDAETYENTEDLICPNCAKPIE